MRIGKSSISEDALRAGEVKSPEWRRLRIALLELGFRRPFADVRLAELLDQADVSRRDFDRLFADLEDCYCGIYAVERDRILAELAVASAPYEAWRDRMRATAYALWRAVSLDERITYFIFVGGRGAGERARLEVEVAMETIFDLLDEGRSEPVSPPLTRATAESIGGAIWNQIAAAVTNGEPMAERVVRYMMYATVMPYLGVEAAEEELEMPRPKPPTR